MRARRGEFDPIIPTGTNYEEIVLGYGCPHAGAGSGELRPGEIAQQGRPARSYGGKASSAGRRTHDDKAGSWQDWENAKLSMEPDGGVHTPQEIKNENRPQ